MTSPVAKLSFYNLKSFLLSSSGGFLMSEY